MTVKKRKEKKRNVNNYILTLKAFEKADRGRLIIIISLYEMALLKRNGMIMILVYKYINCK